jgi:hypothetical protein
MGGDANENEMVARPRGQGSECRGRSVANWLKFKAPPERRRAAARLAVQFACLRRRGYQEALAAAGIAYREDYVFRTTVDQLGG